MYLPDASLSISNALDSSRFDTASFSHRAEGAEKQASPSDYKKISQDFEAIFIRQVLKELRKTIPDGGLFQKTVRDEIYWDMMDANLAEEMAKQEAFGIGKFMYEEFTRFDKLEKPIQENGLLVDTIS